MDSLRSSERHQAKIYYDSVDDYMSREDKLNFLVNKKSIAGISGLTPNPSPTERGFMSVLEGEVSPCAAISQAKYATTPSASPDLPYVF